MQLLNKIYKFKELKMLCKQQKIGQIQVQLLELLNCKMKLMLFSLAKLHKEQLEFHYVHPSQRSYK